MYWSQQNTARCQRNESTVFNQTDYIMDKINNKDQQTQSESEFIAYQSHKQLLSSSSACKISVGLNNHNLSVCSNKQNSYSYNNCTKSDIVQTQSKYSNNKSILEGLGQSKDVSISHNSCSNHPQREAVGFIHYDDNDTDVLKYCTHCTTLLESQGFTVQYCTNIANDRSLQRKCLIQILSKTAQDLVIQMQTNSGQSEQLFQIYQKQYIQYANKVALCFKHIEQVIQNHKYSIYSEIIHNRNNNTRILADIQWKTKKHIKRLQNIIFDINKHSNLAYQADQYIFQSIMQSYASQTSQAQTISQQINNQIQQSNLQQKQQKFDILNNKNDQNQVELKKTKPMIRLAHSNNMSIVKMFQDIQHLLVKRQAQLGSNWTEKIKLAINDFVTDENNAMTNKYAYSNKDQQIMKHSTCASKDKQNRSHAKIINHNDNCNKIIRKVKNFQPLAVINYDNIDDYTAKSVNKCKTNCKKNTLIKQNNGNKRIDLKNNNIRIQNNNNSKVNFAKQQHKRSKSYQIAFMSFQGLKEQKNKQLIIDNQCKQQQCQKHLSFQGAYEHKQQQWDPSQPNNCLQYLSFQGINLQDFDSHLKSHEPRCIVDSFGFE